VTSKQRLHREQDPRVRRSALLALACAAVFVAAAITVVAVRVHQVHLAYRLDAVRAEHARAESLLRQLEVEIATLSSPRRVEAQARQLGMVPPASSQVHLAREFVAVGSGVAAARAARIEALATQVR
jgi:cell division protein FtsL